MGNGTELGRVRGLGSAKEGAHHWWAQRVTAGANLFLMVWFFAAIARMPAYDYDTARTWLQSPWAAIPMGLLIVSVFYHFRLGLQVLIEDYVHTPGNKFACIAALNLAAIGGGVFGLVSIARIALGGIS